MKKERLEELVGGIGAALPEHLYEYEADVIRAALLAVERETVERCAAVCDGRRKMWAESYDREDKPQAAAAFDGGYMSALDSAANAIRSLLTEG